MVKFTVTNTARVQFVTWRRHILPVVSDTESLSSRVTFPYSTHLKGVFNTIGLMRQQYNHQCLYYNQI